MVKVYQWAIVGAGPAGIAATGQLIDHGIPPSDIIWIDPKFQVGDFGLKWQKVSSNTKVDLFNRFFETCRAFDYEKAPKFTIQTLNSADTCLLNFANQPLQWITENLRKKVTSIESKVIGLKLENRRWILSLPQRTILARNVIVAPGAEPHSLNIPSVEEIPLEKALDPSQLTQLCGIDDKIAVFGSSHSAILVLKTLMEDCNVSQVYNFYRSPLSYAVYLDEWILFDDTGLKGMAAEWARENLDGQLPQNLRRLISSEENLRTILPLCSKAIYATGFSSRSIPVEGMETLTYNDRSGIIAPGLFGLGIAFPEVYQDRIGILSQRVGLWKFMEYLIRVMPIWLKYGS